MHVEDWLNVAVLADVVHTFVQDQIAVTIDPSIVTYIGIVQRAMILLLAHDDLVTDLDIVVDLDIAADLGTVADLGRADLEFAVSKNKEKTKIIPNINQRRIQSQD